MFYQVGDQRFTNKFLAVDHAIKSDQHVYFNLYDSAFDRCDWSRDPELTWDQLLDMRARQIAAKNRPIVLNFSGGTDSYTIYRVFERNRIHIDVLYIRLFADEEDQRFKQVYELLDRGLYDPTTKIVTIRDTKEAFRTAYNNPYWILENGVRIQWGTFGNGDIVGENNIRNAIGTDDYISVIGLEKPRLKFENDRVYSFQGDNNYGRVMEYNNIDCFYISPDLPELHVKQSYMLLNYIKSLKPAAAGPGDLNEFNNVHYPRHHPWLDYSILGCGRYGDLNRSDLQQLGNTFYSLQLPTQQETLKYSGRNMKWWTSLADDVSRKNYLQGIMMVADSDIGKSLMQHSDNFYHVNSLTSRPYELTF